MKQAEYFAGRHQEPLFNNNGVPFFPFRFDREGNVWLVLNPLSGAVHELNDTAYWILRLCDGYRTWNEIVDELVGTFRVSYDEVRARSEALVGSLTNNSMVWWRKRRMEWHPVQAPLAVLWDLTARCNLHCRHCVVDSGPDRSTQLSLADCLRLVDEFAALGVQQLILSGGEPLTRKDFFDIAQRAHEKGISLQLATNATLVTDNIAGALAALGACAQVSLDADTPEVHDAFRGCEGAWRRAVTGIRRLVAHKVPVSVAAVVTTVTIDEIPKLYRSVAEMGVTTFRIMPFVPYGRGSQSRSLEVAPLRMRELMETLLLMKGSVGIDIVPMEFECTLHPPVTQLLPGATQRIGCDGAVVYCTVTANGDVLPCNFFAGVECDNVKDKSFDWIWANSRILNYFRSLLTADIHGACASCNWLGDCRGSCIAANFTHGDIFQSNCHCWLASELTGIEMTTRKPSITLTKPDRSKFCT